MRCVAVVLAAGRGKRMNSDIQKQYLLIHEKPVLYYSLDVFEKSFVDEIVLVTGEDEIEYCRREIVEKYGFQKIRQIVAGGKERYHSVYRGIESCGTCDYLMIHDGARPFITEEILLRSLSAVREYGACVAGVRVKDTVKIEDGNGFISETPDRAYLWNVQTPQTFSFSEIKAAYEKLIENEDAILRQGISITDDTMVYQHFFDRKVRLIEGGYKNIKITTPEDLLAAESFLSFFEKKC
ncbi:2-C-methyl-D-erythritol 4-phosphate cytidylyltransferase [bacterium C-53]|nr:2-C-methyl-D-erythritol 4-phosphate cytidylyltransferase [Lachnospiraceae bacterium]NBI04787.1 2-C-methyl-D-erythritol 4-phosphate cytidylyltransferase [Lachnospiraceae bacterium]RKJ07745.1 2-C-methyl-D-erythritol 4-phosphate cytidylyltransferase [bacterium C-53]